MLTADDPAPVWTAGARDAPSPLLILCDHAGNAIPRLLGDLGLAAADRARHIALDLGVEGLARALVARLDAHAIGQRYSRLVIDCNRWPQDAGAIAPGSDGSLIPGNAGLDEAARAARRSAIFAPYHAAIGAELDRRDALGRRTVLLLLHSFTPTLAGQARPWPAGVLYDRDARFAMALRAQLQARTGWNVGDNEPYAGTDGTDYGLHVHAEDRGLAYVELEVRQDLIATTPQQDDVAVPLAAALRAALALPL